MGLSILIFGAVRRKKLLPRRIMDILWWYLICHCFGNRLAASCGGRMGCASAFGSTNRAGDGSEWIYAGTGAGADSQANAYGK